MEIPELFFIGPSRQIFPLQNVEVKLSAAQPNHLSTCDISKTNDNFAFRSSMEMLSNAGVEEGNRQIIFKKISGLIAVVLCIQYCKNLSDSRQFTLIEVNPPRTGSASFALSGCVFVYPLYANLTSAINLEVILFLIFQLNEDGACKINVGSKKGEEGRKLIGP